MREQDRLGSRLLQMLDSRQGGLEACIIRDGTIFITRDIKIHAHNGGLALKTRSFEAAKIHYNLSFKMFAHFAGHINHTVSKAPLIIIPGNDFDKVSVQNFRQRSGESGRMWVVVQI